MIKKYVPRAIEKELKFAAKEFPVIVLTGPRQTGKSTLLQKIFPKHDYVTLDDPFVRKMAQNDPAFFLSRSKQVILDEIQYLPELLPYIKMAVDKDRGRHGRYLLTGSQCFPLMAGLSESLAGRAAIYELLGFSVLEELKLKISDPRQCFSALLTGFFPEPAVHDVDPNRFFSSYLQTYLERDIRQMTSVHDLKIFQSFVELLAARAGNLLNVNEIAKDCGISFTSARRWLSLLENTRIVYLLRPYSRNITKRVVKMPKVYFTDAGLLAFLLRYRDSETMRVGPQSGVFFENLVVTELLKYRNNHHLNFELYFFRDSNGNEVDVVLDAGTAVQLFEIKQTATPRPEHIAALKRTAGIFRNAGSCLLSFTRDPLRISENMESLAWYEVLSVVQRMLNRHSIDTKA
jgi:uncharacterized protein